MRKFSLPIFKKPHSHKTKVCDVPDKSDHSTDPDNSNLNDDEINIKFEKFLEDRNIPKDAQSDLRKQPVKTKLLLMKTDEYKPINLYIDCLKQILECDMSEKDICKILNKVRICLNGCSITWIKEFNNSKNNGLGLLLQVCKILLKKQESSIVILNCIRTFGNNNYGLLELIENESALILISMCLLPGNPKLMLNAVEILTVFMSYNNNTYQKVMDALYKAAKINDYENRFTPLLNGVNKINETEEKESLSLACIQFINVIVSPEFVQRNSVPLDDYYRLHLRREFVNIGLLKIYNKLLSNDKMTLTNREIRIFLEQYTNDEDDIDERLETIIRSFDDIDDIFRILRRTLIQTNCENNFRSILSSLLIIRDDPLRQNLFQFIDRLIAEIIIQDENGFGPDPTLQKFDGIHLQKYFDSELIDELKKDLDYEKMKRKECEMEIEMLKSNTKIDDNFKKSNKVDDLKVVQHPNIIGELPVPPPPGPPPSLAPPGPPPTMFPSSSLPPNISASSTIRNSANNILKQFGVTRIEYKPQLPMKKANWNKINYKNMTKQSFWLSINEEKFSNDILSELEQKFSSKPILMKSEQNKTFTSLKQSYVLDMKTAQNISILIGSLRMDYDKIVQSIFELETSILTPSLIEQLIKSLPDSDQIAKISKMKNMYNELSESEKFCFQLSSIDNLKPRLELTLFQLKFEEKIEEIKQDYYHAEIALSEILQSDCLKHILRIVLTFGNFMNTGSRNQQTIGFELNYLCKLSSTKDRNNEISLIHFLAEILNKHYFDPNQLSNELAHIDKASRLSIDTTNSSLIEMKHKIQTLKHQLKLFKPKNSNDKFLEKMNPFVLIVQNQITIAEKFQTKMYDQYQTVSQYFSFNTSIYKIEDLFTDICSFKTEILEAHKTNDEKRLMNERLMKVKLEKEQREQAKQNDMNQEPLRENSNCVLDNILMMIKSGEGSLNPKRHKINNRKKTENINRCRSRRFN